MTTVNVKTSLSKTENDWKRSILEKKVTFTVSVKLKGRFGQDFTQLLVF